MLRFEHVPYGFYGFVKALWFVVTLWIYCGCYFGFLFLLPTPRMWSKLHQQVGGHVQRHGALSRDDGQLQGGQPLIALCSY